MTLHYVTCVPHDGLVLTNETKIQLVLLDFLVSENES